MSIPVSPPDLWENVPPEVVCQIFGDFHDIADISNAVNVSKTFRDRGKQCVRYLTHPTPMGFPLALITGFNYLQQMMNTVAIVTSVEEARVIRPMYLLKEANFAIKVVGPPLEDMSRLIVRELIDSYLTPVNVVGLKGHQVRQRTFDDSIIRIAIIDDKDTIVQLMVFDHGGKFNIGGIFLELPNVSRHLTGDWEARFIVKYDILEFFREADLGPIDPRLPPGPDNPLLKDRLVFFRAGELSYLSVLVPFFTLYAKRHRLWGDAFDNEPLVRKWLDRYPLIVGPEFVPIFNVRQLIPMLIGVTNIDIHDLVTTHAVPSTREELDNDATIMRQASVLHAP